MIVAIYLMLTDYLAGFLLSLRIDLIIPKIATDARLIKIWRKIVVFNVVYHILVHFLVMVLDRFIPIHSCYTLLKPALNFVSTAVHILYYQDLVNVMSRYLDAKSGSDRMIDLIVTVFTMAIHTMCMYSIYPFINYTLGPSFPIIAASLNFVVLTTYHSIYYFNNRWQASNYNISMRIDMHEKLWPFYTGYSTLATLAFAYSDNGAIMALYNLLSAILLSIPFVSVRYPSRERQYPVINLTFFAAVTNWIIRLGKQLMRIQ